MASKRKVEAIHPLSPAQQGMLYETLCAPDSGIHVEQWSCTLAGDLDGDAFEEAWRRVMERHQVLRTGFVWQEQNEPLQVVLKDVEVPLERHDWSALPGGEPRRRLASYLAGDRRRGFVLSKAPLMRLALLRLDGDSHTLVWTHHHILMDGWCRPILIRELFTAYESLAAGRPVELERTRPYRDYLQWLKGRDPAATRAFWSETLRGFERPLALGRPANGDGALVPGPDEASHAFTRAQLSAGDTDVLRELCRRHRTTLNHLVQGVWALLLSRYGGSDDTVFGVTVSGRPAELDGIDTTIGLFINTLPLRLRVDPGAPLTSWLEAIRDANLEQQQHEHAGSGQIHEWSAVPGALPLYESILVFENYPTVPAASLSSSPAPELALADAFSVGAQTRYPLTLLLAAGETLRVKLIYDRRRLSEEAVESVAGHLRRVLAAIAEDPERPLAAFLDLVPDGEIPEFVPLPQSGGRRADRPYAPPRTPLEEVLAGIWSQVLGIRPVGLDDNFFELGGHSLVAARIVELAREAFEIDLPLKALFDAPTVAGLAAEIARRKGREQEYEDAVRQLPVVEPDPENRYEPFPLTDVQQAYWVGRSGTFELGNVATHLYSEYDVPGMDVGRLEIAWRRMIDRHDMLRAIVLPDGRQRVLEEVPPFEIAVLDLRGEAPEAAEEKLAAMREEMSHQVLPSDRWPLFEMRASLRDGDLVRLHLSLDLLIGDAWSWRILFRELLEFYFDPDLELPPLELSFRDYVLAAVAIEDGELYRRSLDYWRERALSLPPAPELPLAVRPAAVTAPRFVRFREHFDRDVWERLKKRATRAGLTPSGLLLAAFSEVLTTWCKTPRFTINLTMFHRLPIHAQVHDIIGDFTTVTLLAVDHREGATFEARARALQQQLWDDMDHRYVSGVQVLREVRRKQGGAGQVFMPVVFTSTLTLTDHPTAPPGESRLDLKPAEKKPRKGPLKQVYGSGQTPQVWLDHQVSELAEGELKLIWDAVGELFPDGMLEEMWEAYRSLLRRLSEDHPEDGQDLWQASSVGLLPAATRSARQEIHDTGAPLPDGLLHTRFAKQAARDPRATAVVCGADRLSYGELARRAALLAAELRERGAEPESLVAIVLDKSWEQVAAALAVVASGAAYLPVNPALPDERRAYLLEFGEARLALTSADLAARLTWPSGVEILAVDSLVASAGEKDTARPDAARPDAARPADDLAYVIFTSGSTGRPKGVMIEHRAALNTIVDVNQRFEVGAGDRVLAVSSLSFDLSVYDVFGLLAAGGAVVLPEPGTERDPERWLELLEAEGVTIWNTVPALMEMLVEHAEGRGARLPESLRLVMMSGDWIPLDLPDRIRALGPEVEVVSLGGATEASIWSILFPIGEVRESWRSIPYGRAMVNQTFDVLDHRLEPRPTWVPGQLYIGGAGVARGYWRDEERTGESFLDHPATGERLYRTGDLGRFLPEGDIEFLGREDFQVKIRGHRIELGEIEAALGEHPAVESAVVLAAGERQGRHLVAYAVVGEEARRRLVEEATEAAAKASAGEAPPASGEPSPGGKLSVEERAELKLGQPALRDAGAEGALDLVDPAWDEAEVEKRFVERRSYREWSEEPIPAASLGAWLANLRQVRFEGSPMAKHRYGSAGSLYPVQAYLYVKEGRVEGVPGGTYYYHPEAHRLLPLSPGAVFDSSLYAQINRVIFNGSAFSVFLIAHMDAITPLYRERSTHYVALEAGAMSQLLEMAAPEYDLGLCQIGDCDFDSVRRHFDLGPSDTLVHILLGGRVEREQRTLKAFLANAALYNPLLDLLGKGGRAASAAPAERAAPKVDADEAVRDDLRRFLRSKLPEYMVPAHVVLPASLPLTANGKVDRAALAKLEGPRPAAERPAFVAPRNALEKQLAGIWKGLLHVDEVSIHDNFFELGGHSVLMVKAHNTIREELGRELPLVAMFEHPTLSALARYLSAEEVETPTLAASQDRGARRKAAARARRRRRGPGPGGDDS